MGDERYVDAPPSGSEGWTEVWRDDRRYRPGGLLQRLLDKIFRRATSADRDRQRDFNLVLLDLVRDLKADAEAIRRDLRGDVEAVQRDMRTANEALARDMRRVNELVPVAAKRNDALIAALDQKIETLAVRVRDVTNPILTANRQPATSDYIYRRIEDGLRGSEAEVRAAMQPYLDLARNHQPLLDVGCGRGELLMMAKAAGVEASGFDTNERSVADLKQRGIIAEIAGVPECFDGIGGESIGSILASHVVEHLSVGGIFALFREAARVLRRGGLLMIETPNAESLLVSASEFWRDPTHLAPRHPAALVLLAREHGFGIDEVRAIHDFPEGTRIASSPDDPPALRRVIDAINARLFGPQDLRLILRRQ
jgi:O-antigen chain-terminating methyltransferase